MNTLLRRTFLSLLAAGLAAPLICAAGAATTGKSKYPADARVIAGFNVDTVSKAPLDILIQARLEAPAGKVWALIGDHKRLPEWFKSVGRVDILPERSNNRSFPIVLTRQCAFEDKTLTEDIAFIDPEQMAYAYSVNKERSTAMMPMENHVGVFTVEPLGPNESLLSWRQYWDKGLMGLVAAPMMKSKYMDPAVQALIARFGGELVEAK